MRYELTKKLEHLRDLFYTCYRLHLYKGYTTMTINNRYTISLSGRADQFIYIDNYNQIIFNYVHVIK